MRHGEVDRTCAHLVRPGLRPARELHAGLRPPDDLDLAPREAHAAAERLADRLLPGEARRVVLRGIPAAVAVLTLGFREAARLEARVALEGLRDPLDLDQVDADLHSARAR